MKWIPQFTDGQCRGGLGEEEQGFLYTKASMGQGIQKPVCQEELAILSGLHRA